MSSDPPAQLDTEASQRPPTAARIRRPLEQLYSRIRIDEDSPPAPPGLYVRLHSVVAPGSGLQLVGVRRHARLTGSEPLRIAVVDTIADVTREAYYVEGVQRRAMGFGPVRRSASDRLRRTWGLPSRDPYAGGVTPDERVLESLSWLGTAAEAIGDGPGEWPTYVEETFAQLASTARRLVGLSRARVAGAACPYCGRASIHVDPSEADLAVCVNLSCTDEHGQPYQWRGVAQWAALDAAQPARGA